MTPERTEPRFQPTDDGKCAEAAGGMASAAFPEATAAGVEMLTLGGNAIDAACAMGFALGVCEPQASGLGGQTMGIIHFEGRTRTIDGSSRVPALAHRSQLESDDERRTGYRGTTVPSTVAALAWMHRNYGKLPWKAVLAPAIRVARDGYRITRLQCSLQERELKSFLAVPSRSGARYFLKDGERPYAEGELFRQRELADVLETIARKRAKAFYQGDIAAQIDADMRANDGFLRADDLALVPWPIERRPIKRRYRNHVVVTMPPPASGRMLLLVMMMLGHLDRDFLAGSSPSRYHFLAETLRKAFLQRKDRPFDPATYPQIKDKKMLSRRFAGELAASIAEGMDVTLPPEDVIGESQADTTHYSVMDAEGNVASMTQSIELVYGSKAAAAGLGFLYNNYMMALELDDPSHPHYLRPSAVPWSSAAPTIVFRDGEPWLAVGSPGSERIVSTVSHFLVNLIDGSSSLGEAMLAPRFHCSIGGRISLEAERFDPTVISHLKSLGYKIDRREPFDFYLGCVQAVLQQSGGRGFQGVADVRRDGVAAGPG